MAQEQAIPLQTDTVATAPGAPIRTVVATMLVNGVPTPVAMQVVAVASPDGALFDDPAQLNYQIEVIAQLREIRRLLATMAGIAMFEQRDIDNSL